MWLPTKEPLWPSTQPPFADQLAEIDCPSGPTFPLTVITTPFQLAEVRLIWPLATLPVSVTSGGFVSGQLAVTSSRVSNSAVTGAPSTERLPPIKGGSTTGVVPSAGAGS